MSNIYATAGSKVYIGGAKAYSGTDFVASDFSSELWVEIKGTTDLGSFGDTAQLITSEHVNASRTRKKKGTDNAGGMQVNADLDYSDPGQLAMVAAKGVKESFSIRVVFNDAPTGGTPSERLFVGYVMNVTEQLGGPNSVMQQQSTIEIDSNIVRVAAAA